MALKLGDRPFTRRVVIALVVASVFALVYYTARLLLLGFAGTLGAVILDSAATWLASHSRLKRKWAYLCVLAGTTVIAGLIAWLLVPRVVVQVSQIAKALPKAIDNARAYLDRFDWGRIVTSHIQNAGVPSLLSRVTEVGSIVLEIAIAITVTVVLTAYLAEDPGLYRSGFLSLLPEDWRKSTDEGLTTIAGTLRWWLIGQSVPMVVLGLATMGGLLLLHVPLAFTLSLITGLLIFIPFAGAVIAYCATALVALSADPSSLLLVTILFLGIHFLEGYVLTPLVQKRAVYLPPAITIVAQVLMSALFGILGLVLATPLAAVILALVKKFYLPSVENAHSHA